jgi:GNAT superfamily N-acetyltransferase
VTHCKPASLGVQAGEHVRSPLCRIEELDSMLNTPAIKLAVSGWHALLQAGFADEGGCVVQWDQKALLGWVEGDGRQCPVAVLTYYDRPAMNDMWISLAYVLPEWRRKGVHTALFARLVEKAKEAKRRAICSGAHINNTASRQAMLAQGRVEQFVTTNFVVPLEEVSA